MIALALVLIAAALGAVAWTVHGAVGAIGGYFQGLAAVLEELGEPAELEQRRRLADLEDLVERLPQRWEEFKNAARRSEDRARKIVADAREELESLGYEHPGVEAQATELRLHDGARGQGEGVPSVPENVESPPVAAEDWRTQGLRRKFGAQ